MGRPWSPRQQPKLQGASLSTFRPPHWRTCGTASRRSWLLLCSHWLPKSIPVSSSLTRSVSGSITWKMWLYCTVRCDLSSSSSRDDLDFRWLFSCPKTNGFLHNFILVMPLNPEERYFFSSSFLAQQLVTEESGFIALFTDPVHCPNVLCHFSVGQEFGHVSTPHRHDRDLFIFWWIGIFERMLKQVY